ncbi:MAG: Dolichyl-monophosphooligosaccharide--protein glycosyltransferase AglB [Methanoregula sp. PtaU1.Bin051]|nr:MAG: Dolichyl-monophosphooligosaccharide--protein glycosyltransferase AglB [Methanoregula sp. PtaU1.Bin051]
MLSLSDKKKEIVIITLIIFFSLFALWLRLIPMLNLGNSDILTLVGSDDPLYNLRQVEQVLHNFPGYAWFDAMTHFPDGDFIYWGPLFTYILVIACMIAGAVTRPEIIGATLLVPPILATILVPIMYYVGKSCGDWKTGLLSSGFIAVVSGQYFYRSFYGYLDHHIAEVFFATIFCLTYIYALKEARAAEIDIKNKGSLKKPALFAFMAGIAYLLGLFTMPTMILFAMIVAIFTLIQFVIDFYRRDDSKYLVLINSVIFGVAVIGLLLFGIKSMDQISLAVYSVGHIYAYLSLIGGTLALWLVAKALKTHNRHIYPLLLVCIGGAVSLFLLILSPDIFNLLITSFFAFFGQAAEVLTVQEARAWDISMAWQTFNYGLVLMAFGLVILAYKNIKEEHPHQVFALVWSVIILISTWQHIRYEYYLAVNVALLSAVTVTFAFDISWPDISRRIIRKSAATPGKEEQVTVTPEGKRGKRGKKERIKQDARQSDRTLIQYGVLFLISVVAILFVITSVNYSYTNASSGVIQMNPDWRESLEWLGNNTPSTGVDYYAIYEQKTYKYPAQAYGVMSWWDYGHMITFLAKRIPNANPFQRGVAGDTGAASFFMTTSEDAANTIADKLGTQYVITDIEMDSGKFWAMSTWFNNSKGITPYQTYFAVPDPTQSSAYEQVLLNNQNYYLTMVSRLHNFDGSIAQPDQIYYIEYIDPSISKVSIPVVTNAEVMNATAAKIRVSQYNLKAPEGYHAVAMSPAIYLPVDTVPALRHYRLVHESPTNVFNVKIPDIKYVKVFEYVKGAHIKGEGMIEVPIITNTGRTFTYRQQSVNGEFIVPYSTTGCPYNVRATGNYRVVGKDKQYAVSEEAVVNGLTVS